MRSGPSNTIVLSPWEFKVSMKRHKNVFFMFSHGYLRGFKKREIIKQIKSMDEFTDFLVCIKLNAFMC